MLLVSFLILTTAGCVAGPVAGPTPDVSVGDGPSVAQPAPARVVLEPGRAHRLDAAGVGLTFTGVSSDSRCPEGVTCVWEGDAVVSLALATDAGGVHDLQLHANPRFEQAATAAGVRVRLERLDPYPAGDTPIRPEDYRATVLVEVERRDR